MLKISFLERSLFEIYFELLFVITGIYNKSLVLFDPNIFVVPSFKPFNPIDIDYYLLINWSSSENLVLVEIIDLK